MVIKKTNNKCQQRMWGERNPIHCWWECKLVQPLRKSIWRFLKLLRVELPYHPAIPCLGIYPKECKSIYKIDICTARFTAALFTIAKIWNLPRCLTIDDWIKKMWSTHTNEP
jgi:hypothetical protein